MYDISIIIPVYNKEKHLSECLESILNQTYENFEVICINDYSKDKSGKIIEEYAKKDKRLRIINNIKNEGAAPSRNIGIDNAIGEYLLILDADDIFDKNLIKVAYNKCKEKNLDVLIYDYSRMNDMTKEKRDFSMPLSMQKKIENRVFSSNDIEEFSFQMCLAAPWIKMYRKKFILDKNIRFQNLSSSNDGFFGRSILLFEGKYFYLSQKLVIYRTNTENQISKINNNSIFNFIRAISKIKRELEQRNVYERSKKSFCSYAFSLLLHYLLSTNREFVCRVYRDIILELSNILGENIRFQNSYQIHIFRDLLAQIDIKKYLSQFNEYDYIFCHEKNKILLLKEYLYQSNKKVAIWGYGYSGKAFFERSHKENILIDLIVDENYSNFHSNLVKSPQNLNRDDYIILITISAYGKSILKKAIEINQNVVLIDLQCYFTYGFELKDCIFDKLFLQKLYEENK